jgi:hypothetical protein
MRLNSSLTRGLDEAEISKLANEIKHSVLAKQLREFLRKEIELSYRAEEQVTAEHDNLQFYLKEVGERRGYRQVLNLILEE